MSPYAIDRHDIVFAESPIPRAEEIPSEAEFREDEFLRPSLFVVKRLHFSPYSD